MEIEIKRTNQNECIQLEYAKSKENEKIPVLTFPLIQNTKLVKHCFSTKLGGTSTGIFESMNLSFVRGDDKEAVFENFKRIADVMEEDIHNFVFSDQTHTANVLYVSKEDCGSGIFKDRAYKDIDGLITNQKNVVLSTFYADCVPLFFVDPIQKAIGLSHSGWKGTVQRIGAKTIKAMNLEFGSNPKDIICAIGPSICKDCYEVSADVANEFKLEMPLKTDEILTDKGNDKYQLDLWRANEIILLEQGILKEHIQTTNICTCCNPKLLFSHRATNGKRGNLGAFLCLR